MQGVHRKQSHKIANSTNIDFADIQKSLYKWNIHKRAEKRIKCGNKNAKVKRVTKTHKKGLLKMKSSAINRGEIEVPEKGWFIHTHFVPKSKDNTNWNTIMKQIHTHAQTYILYRYILYTYTIYTYIHLEQVRPGSCPEFRPFKMFHVFKTHTHIYIYSHVCLCVYFRLFSMLFSAIFSCILLRQTTLRMRNF